MLSYWEIKKKQINNQTAEVCVESFFKEIISLISIQIRTDSLLTKIKLMCIISCSNNMPNLAPILIFM